jgi:hypothetical protein
MCSLSVAAVLVETLRTPTLTVAVAVLEGAFLSMPISQWELKL